MNEHRAICSMYYGKEEPKSCLYEVDIQKIIVMEAVMDDRANPLTIGSANGKMALASDHVLKRSGGILVRSTCQMVSNDGVKGFICVKDKK